MGVKRVMVEAALPTKAERAADEADAADVLSWAALTAAHSSSTGAALTIDVDAAEDGRGAPKDADAEAEAEEDDGRADRPSKDSAALCERASPAVRPRSRALAEPGLLGTSASAVSRCLTRSVSLHTSSNSSGPSSILPAALTGLGIVGLRRGERRRNRTAHKRSA